MSAARRLKINRGGSVILGIQSKSIAINGEPIETTDGEDNGWQTFDADVGLRSVEISFEGVTKDDAFRAEILAATPTLLLTDITIDYPNGDALSGNFVLTNIEEGGAHGEALKLSGALKSSGAITYTPAV